MEALLPYDPPHDSLTAPAAGRGKCLLPLARRTAGVLDVPPKRVSLRIRFADRAI